MAWDPPELDTDPASVTDKMVDRLMERQPGWESYDGALEVALLESVGAESATLNAGVQEALSVYAAVGIGVTAFQLPVDAGLTASLTADVEVNSVGSEIPTGFAVTGVTPAGVEVAFELLEGITADATTVTVTLTATDTGDYANQVPAGPLTVITSTTDVSAVTATSASTGGADAETLEDYLDRLTDYLASLRPGGVRASDLATLARTVPGVERAIGIDLYDPSDTTPAASQQHERTATVVAIDDAGQAVTSPTLQATLEEAREVNFIVHLAQPKYTAVQIAVTVTKRPTADTDVVEAAVELAVARFIAPDRWGSTTDAPQSWTERSKLRTYDIAAAVLSVPDVASIETIQINGGTADVTLPGPAALPRAVSHPTNPSSVTVTVA